MRVGLLFLLSLCALHGQTMCPDTPVFQVCDIVFEVQDAELKTLRLTAEVKSPRFRTFLAESFWDGGSRVVIRFTPTDDGTWELLLTSNLPRFDKKALRMTAAPSEMPGFVQRANVHHWRNTGNAKPHLWLGYDLGDLLKASGEALDAAKASRATHARGGFAPHWPIDPARFQALEKQIQRLNVDGIAVDLVLAGPDNELTRILPDWQTREKYFRYLLSRLAPYHVTWELVRDWETYRDARSLLKDLGALIMKYDPYNHPRGAYPQGSTAAFLKDGWMTHIMANAEMPEVIAQDHQNYPLPIVAVGKRVNQKVLWNAITAGSYLGYGANPAIADILGRARYWELEPYFDVSNARALQLEGTDYLAYVEKPGIVEVEVEKHGYDAAWINPADGARTPIKEYKGEHFVAEPPSKDHDWILHLSREGRKEGMLKSYKFESRPILMQDPEIDEKRIPFTVNIKDNMEFQAGVPVPFEIKITKDSRATRFMEYVISGDVPTELQGMRVITTAAKGTMILPASLATKFPAVLNLRFTALNANGKMYQIDRIVRLNK
jgi:hypothetical protein